MAKPSFIGYARVSTSKQGESGLGLEAQQAAVERYAAQNEGRLLSLYIEVESGKVSARPELAKALAHAKRSRSTLVVAKLDRLSRNVAFLSALMEASTPFVAVDNPQANALTLHILAAVAEQEAKDISKRTIAALAAYRARGGLLGASRPECRNLNGESIRLGNVASAKTRAAESAATRLEVLPFVVALREKGLTMEAIAEQLNEDGWKTPMGKEWSKGQISLLLRSQKRKDEVLCGKTATGLGQ
jgi:DNA invertase Pin-like site-specific DNA recombinase